MKQSITEQFSANIRQLTFALACGLSLMTITACDSSDDSQVGDHGSTSNSTLPTQDTPDSSSPPNTVGSLGPLPSPPLTEPPSQNDEPVPEDANANTATDLQLVRDPGPRIPKPMEVALTDADFESGPLPAVIITPDNVDPATNAPPDFENLGDVEAIAGELLEILYKPIDADGDLPGMFPEELPQGAEFEDNLDGTKTFQWRPLQMNVGVNEFTVVAVDKRNADYRTKRTIRIRVSLPDDLSTIPNVAPTLEEFVPHTVRQNDAVVLELKGIDLNGDIPTLELVSVLNEASFVQHPRYEEIYILRFIPITAGVKNIQVLARDPLDTSLTSINIVTINVLAETDFNRTGQRLRDLASAQNIQIGYASLPFYYHRPDGGIYAATAASEFNLVTPENSMKMDAVNPLPGRYEFADIDNLLSFARRHDIAVHGHPVIWHRQIPDWVLDVEPSTLQGHMREYIDRLMSRYKNDVAIWDVVNEAIGDNGGFRDSIWYQAMGESYLDIAFLQARSIAPEATLLLNDFDIAFNGVKADTLFTMLDDLIERNVPIDGVGFQLHVFSSFDQFNEVRENFQKVADRGLDIYITEFDVALNEGDSLAVQAQVYEAIVAICLEQPRCKAIQTWGFTDQYSFREIYQPLMFDKNYQPKPAYQAIQNALQ